MKRLLFGLATGVALTGACWAQAQEGVVTVTVTGVASAKGDVHLILCADPKAQFPGACGDYRGTAKAVAGETVVTIPGVKPGRYAFGAWHDVNGDGRTQIPPEGFAYGNNAPWPPAFDAAAIDVGVRTQTVMRMTYTLAAEKTRQMGSKGAPPPAGVARIDVRERGLYGELYMPQGGRDLPGIVLLGGSEGGVDTISSMAVSFAEKGYAALALAYWAEEGLPQTLEAIPLEYFDTGIDWLLKRPEVRDYGVGVLGWSRGSEAALLTGSRNQKVKAVVGIAPSGIVWDGLDFARMDKELSAWTVEGRELPYVTPKGAFDMSQMTAMFAANLTTANRRPETAIPVERTRGPILLISGADDRIWPSAQMGDRVVARLQGAGFRYGYEHLVYPGAGHAIFVGAPDGPMARYASQPNPMMGGTPEANAKAWADNWPKTLAFLDKALKGRAQ
jgi:dienelactone hydrolase/uncharacterized protein (DUF2141 family)